MRVMFIQGFRNCQHYHRLILLILKIVSNLVKIIPTSASFNSLDPNVDLSIITIAINTVIQKFKVLISNQEKGMIGKNGFFS